ncbi:MAG: HzsA-related protein [Planctomycetota bacterium]
MRIASVAITLCTLAQARARAGERPVLALGEWHCIGPFKDEEFGNVRRTLGFAFEPEADALARVASGAAPDLARAYRMKAFPGYLDLDRRWRRRTEWTDGSWNLLPRGPAPSRNETVYLYRGITSPAAASVACSLRMVDYWKVWLNGRVVHDNGRTSLRNGRYPSPRKLVLELRAGENHLLVKNVSRWAEHGFAFAVEGLHAVADPHVEPNDPPADPSPREMLARLRAFKFGPAPIPMHSPSRYAIDDYLARFPASPGAARHDRALAALEADARALVAKAAGGDAGDDEVRAVHARLERVWADARADMPPVLFIAHPFVKVNAIAPYANPGASPSKICRLDPSRPGTEAEIVFHDPKMRIYDMELSYDAKTIFFSGKSGRHWHIYEVGVGGTGLRQITTGDHDNISPCELPSGRIAFVSTRTGTFVQCQGQRTGLLYTVARDGTDVRLISGNIDSDHRPQVLADGRIIFTRWDYGIEKNVFARHALWSVRPDGTGLQLVFGNTIEDPAGFWKPRPVPGRPELVCVLGPHRTFQAGMIGLVWNGRGPEAPRGEGFRWVTREVPCYGDRTCGNGYQDPFPVHEKLFIVSYGGAGGKDKSIRLYLLDAYGNRSLLHRDPGGLSCYGPVLLRPRERPPVIPPMSSSPEWTFRDPEEMNRANDLGPKGTMLVRDVYRGIGSHVARGEAKYIQVVEQVQKSRRMAGGEAWGHTPIIGRGTVHVRRVLGLVPLEADGSAHFEVPALRSISLNVLDQAGRALMRMGSDIHLMPGESASCIGCHEVRESSRGGTAPPAAGGLPLAARMPPVKVGVPEWGTGGIIDYLRVVQPVWDRHCVRCHKGHLPKGAVDMTADRTRFFCQSYDQLVDRDVVDHLSVFSLDHDETTPKTVGAVVSRIDKFLDNKHCESDVTWDERYRVYAWIDVNVPYYGTYDYAKVNGRVRGIGARDGWEAGREQWARGPLADVFRKRCYDCHERRVFNPSWYTPGDIVVTSERWGEKAIASHGFPKRYPLSGLLGPEYRVNLTNPDHSLILRAPLAKDAGGFGLCAQDGAPVFKSCDDPGYRTMLTAITMGKVRLYTHPRVDMDAAHVEAVRKTLPPVAELQAAVQETMRSRMGLSEGVEAPAAVPKGAVNLARGAKATSPDGVPIQGAPPRVSVEAAVDGNPDTFWDDVDGRKLYRLALDFGEERTVSVVSITGWNHHDFAPRSFRILCNGKGVGRVGGAVYANNRFTFSIPRTRCRTFELAIDGSWGGSPAIRELELFDAPSAPPRE